jgi:hypothetical protein
MYKQIQRIPEDLQLKYGFVVKDSAVVQIFSAANRFAIEEGKVCCQMKKSGRICLLNLTKI